MCLNFPEVKNLKGRLLSTFTDHLIFQAFTSRRGRIFLPLAEGNNPDFGHQHKEFHGY